MEPSRNINTSLRDSWELQTISPTVLLNELSQSSLIDSWELQTISPTVLLNELSLPVCYTEQALHRNHTDTDVTYGTFHMKIWAYDTIYEVYPKSSWTAYEMSLFIVGNE